MEYVTFPYLIRNPSLFEAQKPLGPNSGLNLRQSLWGCPLVTVVASNGFMTTTRPSQEPGEPLLWPPSTLL